MDISRNGMGLALSKTEKNGIHEGDLSAHWNVFSLSMKKLGSIQISQCGLFGFWMTYLPG